VESWTEGVTGLLSPGFASLAAHAWRRSVPGFDLDFLNRRVVPAPDESVADALFDYRNLPEWFEAVGCSIEHISAMTMRVEFDLTSVEFHPDSREWAMAFTAHTEIMDDRHALYSHDHAGRVWFGGWR
jgi:hypothetical protein